MGSKKETKAHVADKRFLAKTKRSPQKLTNLILRDAQTNQTRAKMHKNGTGACNIIVYCTPVGMHQRSEIAAIRIIEILVVISRQILNRFRGDFGCGLAHGKRFQIEALTIL